MNIKPHLKHVQDINADNDSGYKYRYLSMKPEHTKNLHPSNNQIKHDDDDDQSAQ